MPAKAAAAIIHSAVSFNERREILSKASMTMASTAALMPRNSALTSGTDP